MRWKIISVLFLFVFVSSISMGLEIQKGDSVYFKIDGYEITTPDFKLNPYFRLYRQKGNDWEKVTQTWSFTGGQSANIPDVESYYLEIEDNGDVYRIDVRGVKHNMVSNDKLFVATGRGFKVPDLLKAEQNSQPFEISPQNTLTLKRLKKDGNTYKLGIDSYKIGRLDENFIQQLAKDFPISLLVSDGENELGNFATKFGTLKQDLHEAGNEVLLKWEDGKSFTFWLKNDMGNIAGIEIKAEKLFSQLCETIKNNPDDKSKWQVTIASKDGNKIFVSFAGIQRLYRLDSVDIPKLNEWRTGKFLADDVYKLNVKVRCNGKTCNTNNKIEKITADEKSWSPKKFSKNNLFEIREGISWQYTVWIEAKDESQRFGVPGDEFGKPIVSNSRPEPFKKDEMTVKFSLTK